MNREKRTALRVQVALTAHCRIGNHFVRDAICNLSRTGLYLRTRERAKEGTPVRVAIALPYADGPRFCTLVGNVARIERDVHGACCGLGVSFAEDEIGSVDRRELETFLSVRNEAA